MKEQRFKDLRKEADEVLDPVTRLVLDKQIDTSECSACFGSGRAHSQGRVLNQACTICNGLGVVPTYDK